MIVLHSAPLVTISRLYLPITWMENCIVNEFLSSGVARYTPFHEIYVLDGMFILENCLYNSMNHIKH